MRILLSLAMAACAAGQTISISSGASAAAPLTVRVGVPMTLSITGGAQYWLHISGPVPIRYPPSTASSVTITPRAAGEYTVKAGSTTFSWGAVATTSTGAVALPASKAAAWAKIMGVTTRAGLSPWPFQDTTTTANADAIITYNAANTSRTGAEWTIAQAGTISVTNGSAVITGSGTSLKTVLCNGTIDAIADRVFVHWHATGKRAYSIANDGCTSETSITLSSPIETATASGQSWSYMTESTWAGGSDNINYYDAVLAFYAEFYRTGRTKYVTEARRLAALWYNNPAQDRGRRNSGPWNTAPRIRAWAGVMWWLYETGAADSEWTNLYEGLDYAASLAATTSAPGDVREDSYGPQQLAVAAILSPNSTKRDSYRAILEGAALTRWQTHQRVDGAWVNPFNAIGFGGATSQPGTLTLVNGSTAVVGVGTTFTSGMCPVALSGGQSNWITIWASPDTEIYRCAFVDSTHITLDRPYAGTTRSGATWNIGNPLAGTGVQPFIMGLALSNMSIVREAVGSSAATQWAALIQAGATWMRLNARDPATGASFAGRLVPGCEPPETGLLTICRYAADATEEATLPTFDWYRKAGMFVSTEGIGGMARAHLISPSGALATEIDRLAGATYGKDGGPYAGAVWADELRENGISLNPKVKDFGFCCGVGNNNSWPAARLGGYTAVTSTLHVHVGAGASADMMTLAGDVVALTCASGVCSGTYDAALGDVLPLVRVTRGAIVGEWQ